MKRFFPVIVYFILIVNFTASQSDDFTADLKKAEDFKNETKQPLEDDKARVIRFEITKSLVDSTDNSCVIEISGSVKGWYYGYYDSTMVPLLWIYRDGKSVGQPTEIETNIVKEPKDANGAEPLIKTAKWLFKDTHPVNEKFSHTYIVSFNQGSQFNHRLGIIKYKEVKLSSADSKKINTSGSNSDYYINLLKLDKFIKPSNENEIRKLLSGSEYKDFNYYNEIDNTHFKTIDSRIMEKSGKVFIKKYGTEKFVELTREIKLGPGDTIKTEKNSSARISTIHGNMRFGENTLYQLTSLESEFFDPNKNDTEKELIKNYLGYLLEGGVVYDSDPDSLQSKAKTKVISIMSFIKNFSFQKETADNYNVAAGIRSKVEIKKIDDVMNIKVLRGNVDLLNLQTQESVSLEANKSVQFDGKSFSEIKTINLFTIDSITKLLNSDDPEGNRAYIIFFGAIILIAIILRLLKRKKK